MQKSKYEITDSCYYTKFLSCITVRSKNEETKPLLKIEDYVKTTKTLTLDAAWEMSERVLSMASKMDKKVSLAILDASGNYCFAFER